MENMKLENMQLSIKEEDTSFSQLRSEYQNDIDKNEAALDLFCDTVCKDAEMISQTLNTKSDDKDSYKIGNRRLNVQSVPVNTKRQTMDSTKKTKLLAALKAINSKNSFDS